MNSIFARRIKLFRRRHMRVRRSAALVIGLGGMIALLIVVLALQSGIEGAENTFSSPWHYKCDAGYCKKELISDAVKDPLSLEECELFCSASSTIWPKPTGHLSLSKTVVHLDPDQITFTGINTRSLAGNLLEKNVALLKENVKKGNAASARSGGLPMSISFIGIVNANDVKITLDTNESYTLILHRMENAVQVTINAETYFGARHALETLGQLIIYDDLRNEIKVASDVYISDSPVYPYRGVLLDTSRNFVSKATILRTIEAMSMAKLNTFHWHITDSQSFPYVSKTWPKFSELGSYAPDKIYTHEDVKEIVDYGLLHGVRVLPEFDAPAHVGEGWQWVGDNATVCFKAEPWQQYCVEPPCGQLNPTSDRMYEVLEGIYKDMVHDFNPDIFHMGGDEVNVNCWNSSEIITTWMQQKGWNLSESSFYLLWNHFQEKALEKLSIANEGRDIPVILWTSGLTSVENLKYLDPKKYIIQIWTTAFDEIIGRLLRNDYRMIFSNYDALYLDCGFASWVGEGTNWCAPYKGWQKIYDNSPLKMAQARNLESKKHLIMGGEAALWTEQADSAVVDSRIWPRAAALGERLWAEPSTTWRHAEHRMLRHRERIVKRGIPADTLQPEWCLRNQGHCYS